MTSKAILKLLAAGACLTFLAAGAEAHDPRKGGGIPAKIAKRMMEHEKNILSMDDSDAAKGVYSTMVQWPPTYPKLRVCFFDGSNAARIAVMEVANHWMRSDIGLRFDWGKKGKPRTCNPDDDKQEQIRVSFNQPGYWSLLGQASSIYAAQNEASLNLEGLGDMKPDQIKSGEAAGVILHEFGHALGLMHEHQSPAAVCGKEFNWEFITNYLSGAPNNWDEETISFNMKPMSGDDLMMTDFDIKSIMLYSFPAQYYIGGESSKCFIAASNNAISDTDYATVAYMYPAEASARMEQFEKQKAGFQAIWDKSAEQGRKGVMIDMVSSFFGTTGTADIADDAD